MALAEALRDVSQPLVPAPPPQVSETERTAGLVAASVYSHGSRVADITLDEAGDWSRRPDHVVWIGLHEPTPELLARIQAQFGLHPLAIEDALTAHQRPKLEQYGNSLFVVARTAQMINNRLEFGETHIFVGRGYVVSVRHGPSKSYQKVRARAEACPKTLSNGEDYILYAILDFIVDNFAPVLEAAQEQVDGLETAVLAGELTRDQIEQLYILRRDLLRLRAAVVPLVEVCQRIEHSEVMPIDPPMRPLFRDVTDHVKHTQEETDALREVLAFAFEAGLIINQAQQTAISRRLAAWAAILAVPTAVAGIYGMNFDNMPELHWRYGYFAVLGFIMVVCGVLFALFRRNKWV